MKHLIVLLLGLFVLKGAQAQTAEDSVKAVINQLFTGMKNADGSLLKQCFADTAIMQTIGASKEGKTIIRTEKVSEFIDFVQQQAKDAADERIEFGSILVDGSLASVWTPYKFYYKGKFSHCGVNSFQLVRIQGQWKIQYLIDTRRRQGCE